jgi:hypothetical protein
MRPVAEEAGCGCGYHVIDEMEYRETGISTKAASHTPPGLGYVEAMIGRRPFRIAEHRRDTAAGLFPHPHRSDS